MKDRCHICNALINEDGTVDSCLGECDLPLSQEYDAMKELDFSQPGPRSIMDERPGPGRDEWLPEYDDPDDVNWGSAEPGTDPFKMFDD